MKRLIFFQVYDYKKTYASFQNNAPETYLNQKKSSEFIASLINKYGIDEVCVVCFGVSEAYEQVLANGVRAKGIPCFLTKQEQIKSARKFIDLYPPTRAIVQVPLPKLIKYCVRKKIKTIVIIADSFCGKDLRRLIAWRLLAWRLNNQYIEWVSNHNYPASCFLKNLGVKARKIVPWDLPWDIDLAEYPLKAYPENHKTWKFFYAGRISLKKGVGDIIQAVYSLKKKNIAVKVVFAGDGNIAEFEQQSAALGIADGISFLGTIAHDQVLSGMRQADIVLVPSQNKSGEGMPLTIYESFLVKTPLIISDHPMFQSVIKNGIFFKAGNPASLAQAIQALIADPVLYDHLSQNSAEAFKNLKVPFSVFDIIQHWLSGTEIDKHWLYAHSLEKLNKLNR